MEFITGSFTSFRKAGVGLFRPAFKKLENLRIFLDFRFHRSSASTGRTEHGWGALPRIHRNDKFCRNSAFSWQTEQIHSTHKPDQYISIAPASVRKGFGISSLFCEVQQVMKNAFLVIWCILVLSLNTSCTPPSDKDHFDRQEGRTVHDIRKFLVFVSAELQMESEKAESSEKSEEKGVTSAPVEGASNSGKKSKRQLKQVDWIQAPHLTEEHLKKLGALRIKTVSKGEPIKNSTSQIETLEDTYSRVPFNTQYYRINYEFLDVNLPPKTSMDSVKEEQEKLWAFLLGRDIESFYGFPDTVYYILPHVESNYLILYRLGLPGTIPYDQLPLARRVGDFLATPLVGYPVKYCLSEKDKNIYGETTDQATPNCEGIPLDSAKYVNFETDKKHKKLFKYEEKLDLFPADFFNGEWLYLRTEIQSDKIKNDDAVSDPSFQTAHLVEFQKKSNQLVVMDSSQYGLDEKDRQPVLFIPVKWKEYEMDRDVDFFNSFAEREKKPAGSDVERPYFLLDFQQLKSFEETNLSGATYAVKNILVTEDFLSFNIETNRKGGFSSVVKYSFRRAVDNPDYPQKQWHERDSSIFHPVSYIEQKHYVTPLYHTKADKEQFYRVTRFNPNQEEIRWYFSTQTPKDDWVRDFGRQAIAYENRVFQEAGKYSPRKIKVVLDEKDGDKELGDIRYNIINLVVTETAGATAFGVGSHVTHPVTGEIISAVANVWVSYIVDKNYVPLIRQYIRFHIWPPSWKLLPSSRGASDFLHGKIQKLCPEVAGFIAENKGVVPPFHPVNSKDVLDDGDIQIQCARKLARTHILHNVVQEIRHGHGFRHVFSASADTEHHYKDYDEIEALFGDVENMHNSPFPVWEDNLIKDQKDWEGNLIEDQKTPPYYSSVMDQIDMDFPILPVPGKYDIAATRYLYFDQLETTDDKDVVDGFVTLDSGDKNIAQEIGEGSVLFTDLELNQSRKVIEENRIKRYYVCGGKNLEGTSPDEHRQDPFCTPWDYGRTPKEKIMNKILNIKLDLMLYSKRYDSDELSKNFPISHPNQLIKLIVRWSKLRDQALKTAGKNIYDFSSFIDSDIEEYEGIIAKAIEREKARHQSQMTEAEKAKCEESRNPAIGDSYFNYNRAAPSECIPYSDLEAYSEIIPHLADFYQELLFIPPKQCVYQKESAFGVSYQTVALEVVKAKVKNIYPEGSTEALFNCQSEAFKRWAEQKGLGRFIAEVGGVSSIRDNVKYLIQPPAHDPGDEHAVNGFIKDMLDETKIYTVILEPGVRKVLFQRMRDFWLKGYDLNPYIDGVSLRETLGLSNDEDLPLLPRFTSYEITDLIPDAKQNQIQIMGHLERGKSLIEFGSKVNSEVRRQVRVHHDMFAETDIPGFEHKLSQLTESNPDQAEQQMSIAYEEYLPFIYQTYQRYTEDYNTPEKRQDTPFSQFLANSPSVLSLFRADGNVWYIVPSDERSLWVGIFRKYHEYKACLGAAEITRTADQEIIATSCEGDKKKEAYIKLIDGILLNSQGMNRR